MKMRNETDSLNELIVLQEQKHDSELKALKEQFDLAYESLKPVNLIKSLFHEVTASPEIKNDFVGNIIGLGTGFISKKFFGINSQSPVKNMLGTILQFAMTNVVAKHSDSIKNIGSNLLSHFLHKNKS
ncbi:hypothetical protein DOS84_03155 [Flavobacterium aquariorum]|uniref:Uncharacterized protein n=1 Tax=Flavobacterium aquariorum TaxID=2217670 RepID=A0A2W7UAU1_9FLAO|nr:hypothetical protein [Flavobacterium aquariorum]PZX94569.1 hypothetical protein DOS84_03155 [Flavobacterium aquariorum]